MSSRRILKSLAALVVACGALVTLGVAAPVSRAVAGDGDGPAVTPHTNVAAIYDEFGLNELDTKTLDTVAGDLTDEGYEVDRYTDTTQGTGDRGGATLANFVAMAMQASVIVINGHGYDPKASRQSCPGGKGFVGYGDPNPLDAVDDIEACADFDQPIVQVEWYPTIDDANVARSKYLADGYKDRWLTEPIMVTTNVPARKGDRVPVDENGLPAPQLGGARPALFLTAAGVAHFFGRAKIDLVDVMACQTMALAQAFNARTFFGHQRTACTGFEDHDEPQLFDRLTGHSGVEARSTTAAFGLGGWSDQYFKMADTSKPVVLSPAVALASPGDGGGVTGTTTDVSLTFDSTMAKSAPKRVVSASGCSASIADAKWSGDTGFTFAVKVPKIQPGKTMTLTVHHAAAKSAGGYAHVLDGNQDPREAGESGVAPNGDDYVWHLSCAPSTKFEMVYTGTYELEHTQTPNNLPPTNETGSYTWTQTQIIDVSSPSPYNSLYESTTTLEASGSSSLDGNALHVSCTIQTPSGYGWTSKRTGGKYEDGAPIAFQWSIQSPPLPGATGVTGTAGNNGGSGCTSDGDFTESYGLPAGTALSETTAIDSAQAQMLLDAQSGSISLSASKLPQTKHFDIEGSGTDGPDTSSLKFHGTLTFSKL